MNIFIDEAGVFVIPNKKKWQISCVGALVLPECRTNEIFREFTELKRSWGVKEGEIKGSRLNEPEVDSLINVLAKYDVIYQVTAIDMNMQSAKQLTKHRLAQAANLIKNLTENHQKTLIEVAHGYKDFLTGLTNQLYVQSTCIFELLYNVIQISTLYYSQRIPQELAEFYWTIDAKDKKVTPFETYWSLFVPGAMQSKSFDVPLITLDNANYSYFKKYCDVIPEAPEHIRHLVKNPTPYNHIKNKDILAKHLIFEQSHANLGIQLVDILTNSIRRAMNGKLKIQGWGSIGKLMVQPIRDKQVIHLIDLAFDKGFSYAEENAPYWKVLQIVNENVKPLLK